jgi:hypothetical protein
VAAGRARGSRPRRVRLPGVAELLRPVGPPGPASDLGRQASGREAHSQKITVYLSADEFLDLERARLALRAHGIGVDRGRLVREAIALLIMDLEMGIDASAVGRRLRAAAGPDATDGAAANRAVVSSAAVNGAVVAHSNAGSGAVVNGAVANGAAAGAAAHGAAASGAVAACGLVNCAAAHGGRAHGAPASVAPAVGAWVHGGPVNGAPAGPQ